MSAELKRGERPGRIGHGGAGGRFGSPLQPNSRLLRILAPLLSVLAVGIVVYWPGLAGPFLLDDFPNLAPLGNGGGIRSLNDWLRFVFGGEAGTLGRPISLASFTLNAVSWPTDPWPFKLTNLAIHLLSSGLVFALALRLYRLTGMPGAPACAWVCAAVWTLHPLQVSTVLYVVQRMAELTALFTLAGVYAYVHGRERATKCPRQGYAWMIAGIVGGGALATLSKENGALLPLYALALEVTVLRQLPPPPGWRRARAWLLHVPVLLLLGWIALNAPQWLGGYQVREFSLGERVQTQGLILLDYLYRIAVPRLSGSGLFFDDYPILTNPALAAACWTGIGALIVAAFALRRRHAVAAAAILWFFSGHLLESTVLPLELYFEHRNYLPLFGPALLLGPVLSRVTMPRIAAAVTMIVLLGLMTWAQARVWGNEMLAAEVWPAESPGSARAHQIAAIAWQKQGRFDRALNLMRDYATRHPQDPTAWLQLIEASCATDDSVEDYAQATIPLLRTGLFSFAAPDALEHLIRLRQRGGCVGLTQNTLLRMIEALGDNRALLEMPDQYDYLTYIEATAHAAERNFRAAIATAERSARRSHKINFSYWQAVWSLEAGDVESARGYTQRAHAFEAARPFAGSQSDPFLAALDRHLEQPSAPDRETLHAPD